uniref:Uncharacterized protein n=1 Tax=Thermofilum pendens TaxID=2269 RepID=A0A7J3X7Y6_THEPE
MYSTALHAVSRYFRASSRSLRPVEALQVLQGLFRASLRPHRDPCVERECELFNRARGQDQHPRVPVLYCYSL